MIDLDNNSVLSLFVPAECETSLTINCKSTFSRIAINYLNKINGKIIKSVK